MMSSSHMRLWSVMRGVLPDVPAAAPARVWFVHQSPSCRCVLVAHDWGAFVAWFTAALYPAAVQKLVIMGLPHPTAWKVNLDFNQMRRWPHSLCLLTCMETQQWKHCCRPTSLWPFLCSPQVHCGCDGDLPPCNSAANTLTAPSQRKDSIQQSRPSACISVFHIQAE